MTDKVGTKPGTAALTRRLGADITVGTGSDSIDAYLAVPEEATGPGVVLISTIFGIDEDTKTFCDELARKDCVAIAPNFFARDEVGGGPLNNPAQMQQAIQRQMRLDFPRSMQDLVSTIARLKDHPQCNGRVALLGFCFGGPYAWHAACDGLGIDAALSFHGSFLSRHMSPNDRPACPVSIHYGDHDFLAPADELEAVRKTAEPAGAEFVIHPGAKHGYMMRSIESDYQAAAAQASWARAHEMIDALR